MELKTPDTSCELITNEHVLKINRGNSPYDYMWNLYDKNGKCIVGGGSPSFAGVLKEAEKSGFAIIF